MMITNAEAHSERERSWVNTAHRHRVLEPFVHQVSGRAHMLTLNPSTICKSLSKREWNFYDKLPTSLRQFTPHLKGVLFVQLEKGKGNSHRFKSSGTWIPHESDFSATRGDYNYRGCKSADVGFFSNGNTAVNCLSSPQESEQSPYWHRTFEQTLFKGLERVSYSESNGFTSHAWTVDKDQEAVTEALGKNPWALRQHKREINRTLRGDILRKEVDLSALCQDVGFQEPLSGNDRFTKGYLLLEDVTSNYRFPSILDLKIGTQLDRYGCSQAKKDKHFNLVQKSSTGSLGLRLAGMQVYQVATGQYLCRDKYYGRGLSTKGFIDALGQFLNNGQRMVTEVIPQIVDRLVALRRELENQDSFRFHASSVLISYEGASLDTSQPGSAVRRAPSRDSRDSLSDLQNGFVIDESPIGEAVLKGDLKIEGQATNLNNNNSIVATRPAAVHMIDFAHSTYEGFLDDKSIYQGPDRDCLHALDNLVSVLNNIKKTSTPG